jgi:hypothetical protein
MPPVSPIKLTMSSALPVSTHGSKGLASPQAFEFKTPLITRKNEFENNRDSAIEKKKIGINALNGLRVKSLGTSVDVADICPVSTSPSNSVLMKVRKAARGGGDVLGTQRLKTPLERSMTEKTLISMSNSMEFDGTSVNDSIVSSLVSMYLSMCLFIIIFIYYLNYNSYLCIYLFDIIFIYLLS